MRRWLLGAATFWPLIHTGCFAAVAAAAIADGQVLVPAQVLFALQVPSMFMLVALLVAYLRDAYRNPQLSAARRKLWIAVLFAGSTAAMPVYWWLYVRPGGRMLAAPEPPGR